MPGLISLEDFAEAATDILRFLDERKMDEAEGTPDFLNDYITFDDKAIVVESKDFRPGKRIHLSYVSNEKRGPILEITINRGNYQFNARTELMLPYYTLKTRDSSGNFVQERMVQYGGNWNPIKSIQHDLKATIEHLTELC